MANQKISELTSYTTPISNDLFAIVDITTMVTKKITFSDLKTELLDSLDIGVATGTSLSLGGGGLFTGSIFNVYGSVAGTFQNNIQNGSDSTSASSDLVMTADTGTNIDDYVDIGINSSTYNDANYTIGSALSGYLYSYGGDLTIGTGKASKIIKFHTGGTLISNLISTINDNGLLMSTGKSIKLQGATSGTVTIQTPAEAGTITLTTPATTGTLVATTDTQTLTNKRWTMRTGTTTSSATPTINTDNVDMYLITAQTADITSFTTNLSGTPTEGQKLWISITGTATRAITWGTSFENGFATLPSTTVGTARIDTIFVWNSVTSKWRCMGTGPTS